MPRLLHRSVICSDQSLLSFSSQGAGTVPDAQLTRQLRDLYQSMGRTTDAFPPLAFLNVRRDPALTAAAVSTAANLFRRRTQMLRQFAPQFAERSRQTGQYAQQDAQEAWGAILQAAKSSSLTSEGGNFVEKSLTGQLEKT